MKNKKTAFEHTIDAFRVIKWWDLKKDRTFWGIDAKIEYTWYHLKDDNGPMWFKTRAEARNAKAKESKQLLGIAVIDKKMPLRRSIAKIKMKYLLLPLIIFCLSTQAQSDTTMYYEKSDWFVRVGSHDYSVTYQYKTRDHLHTSEAYRYGGIDPAEYSVGGSYPNPPVACKVIVRDSAGKVLMNFQDSRCHGSRAIEFAKRANPKPVTFKPYALDTAFYGYEDRKSKVFYTNEKKTKGILEVTTGYEWPKPIADTVWMDFDGWHFKCIREKHKP